MSLTNSTQSQRRSWANLVRSRMKADDWNIEYLAEEARVGRPTIYRLLAGEPTRPVTRYAIAIVLGIDPEEVGA